VIDIVDPGVVRIRLPRPAAHVYVLFGRRIALVDAGTRESIPALLEALRLLGVGLGRVSLVVLTHEHADHAGGAGAFPQALLTRTLAPPRSSATATGARRTHCTGASRRSSSSTAASSISAASRFASCTRRGTLQGRSACTSAREG